MVNRRGFLFHLSLASAGTVLLQRSWANTPVKKKNIGVQLYTVRDAIFKDAKKTLEQIAQMGYTEVENFGYNGNFFGMKAAAYRSVLSDLQLGAPSGHYLYGNVGDKKNMGTVLYGWDKAIEDAKTIGQDYMVLAYLMPEERKSIDDYKQIAAHLNKAGEACKKAGIQLCYHNHDFEFQAMNGQVPMEVLTKETDKDLVKIELDLYWAVKAGVDPVAYFNLHPGRVALWHVKDMDNTPSKNFTEVGKGVIDFATIFKAAKKSGMQHFFVEQDSCPGSPFDSISTSIAHVKSHLLQLL
jgi:sugar phosphate isomerase/epimerase